MSVCGWGWTVDTIFFALLFVKKDCQYNDTTSAAIAETAPIIPPTSTELSPDPD